MPKSKIKNVNSINLKFIISIVLSFLVCGCTSYKKQKIKNEQNAKTLSSCKLPRIVEGSIALGFPKVEGLAPSIGKVNMTVLFTDFNDVPAEVSTDSIFSIINPIAPDFFKEVSYGRMELNLIPHHKWLRLSKPSSHYGNSIYRFEPHRKFIQEAVDLADGEVDFSQTHIVLVISNPKAKEIQLGPTFNSQDPYWGIKADGVSISSAITSGYDLNHWGGIWLPHETGHTFGLPDLYHFGTDNLNRYVGTFGLMGTCGATAPGYFAYERWILGWLDDSQILCHTKGKAVYDVQAIENIGGIKAIVVPLDSSSVLVVESRRKIGFDKNMGKEGALVYVVNTALEGGSGPIQIKPGVNSEFEFLQDAPMVKGDVYTYKNVTVEILDSRLNSDKVEVSVITKKLRKYD
jgi:M6 family metalloprotease-like protein